MKVDFKFVLLFLTLMILQIAIGGKVISALFYIVLIILVLAIITFIIRISLIEINMKSLKDKIVVGMSDKYGIEIANKSLFYVPDILVKGQKNNDIRLINLKANTLKKITYPFIAKVRGLYVPDSIEVTITDIFNIFTSVKNIDIKEVKVYPNVDGKIDSTLNLGFIGNSKKQISYLNENPYITKEIRKYNPGDNIKRINWKVSAKHSELFVRKDEIAQDRDIKIVVDMNSSVLEKDESGIYENKLITDALNLSYILTRDNVPHKFIFNDGKTKDIFVKNDDDFSFLLNESINTKADTNVTLLDYYNKNRGREGKDSVIFVFTVFTEESFNALLHLNSEMNKLYVLTPKDSFAQFTKNKTALNFIELKGDEYDEK